MIYKHRVLLAVLLFSVFLDFCWYFSKRNAVIVIFEVCVFGCRLGMEILLQHCQTLLLHDMTHEEHIQVVRHLKSGMHNE